MRKYLLDSNIFIQAKNLHYGFDFCPAFWDWLNDKNASGIVASIDHVQSELQGFEDELSDWAEAKNNNFFLPADDAVATALAEVSHWATTQNYEAAAISTFLQVADYWLVAHAKAHDRIVVTHEIPSDGIKKIKIPNACIGLGIKCVNPYEMLRIERARFVLSR